MTMSRVTLLLFTLFSCLFFALATPVPETNTTLVDIEKRITHVGRGTWFYPGLGNCGKWNTANDLILAISKGFYDENKGGNCDQWVHITNVANGKTAYGLTRDSCQSCGRDDIDMSPALFSQLSTLATGQIKVSWNFMPKGFHP